VARFGKAGRLDIYQAIRAIRTLVGAVSLEERVDRRQMRLGRVGRDDQQAQAAWRAGMAAERGGEQCGQKYSPEVMCIHCTLPDS